MRTPDEARDFAQRCYWTEPKPEYGAKYVAGEGSMQRVTEMIRRHKEQPQPGALMFWQAPSQGGHVMVKQAEILGYPTIKAYDIKEGHVIVGSSGGRVEVWSSRDDSEDFYNPEIAVETQFGWLSFPPDEDVHVEQVDV